MKRRDVIAVGGLGALGAGAIVGKGLYGSSALEIERTSDGAVIREGGERIDTLPGPVTLVEGDDAVLAISIPDRTTVNRVAVEAVWTITRDGLWSGAVVELASTTDAGASLDPGGATTYGSTWGRSPSHGDASTSQRRRYAYPRGTTAGRADTALTVHPGADPGRAITVEARLSARSLGGTRVELSAPVETTYDPE